MSKRKCIVLTDSACDLPPELAEKHGVDILNFQITVDDVSYTEREDFDFDGYYEMLRNCVKVPTTAQVTMPRFLERFEGYDDQGMEDVLYVSINSTGSSTYNSSIMAREEFYKTRPKSKMKIHIVDSHAYSMPYGWYVAGAARKLNNGADMDVVIEWLEDIFARVEILLAAFSLKFMKKSGRVSAAAAFAGELLGLKPIITLNDGVSTVQRKVRGNREVLPALLEYADAHIDDTKEYAVGGTDEETMKELAALCTKKWKAEPLIVFKLGAAVATNTGPDAIAIFYLGEKRER